MTTKVWLSYGDKVWYSYRIPGLGLTGQRLVTVHKFCRVKVRVKDDQTGRTFCVLRKNLRPAPSQEAP